MAEEGPMERSWSRVVVKVGLDLTMKGKAGWMPSKGVQGIRAKERTSDMYQTTGTSVDAGSEQGSAADDIKEEVKCTVGKLWLYGGLGKRDEGEDQGLSRLGDEGSLGLVDEVEDTYWGGRIGECSDEGTGWGCDRATMTGRQKRSKKEKRTQRRGSVSEVQEERVGHSMSSVLYEQGKTKKGLRRKQRQTTKPPSLVLALARATPPFFQLILFPTSH
jgi:hypothetical protein